jgi:hypothetical protein
MPRIGTLRACATVIAAAAAIAACPRAVLAATVTFDPPHGQILGLDTLAVDVRVDAGATDIRGFTFVLEFDPNIVRPVTASAGALVADSTYCRSFFAWVNHGAVGDSVWVDGAKLGCSAAGPGALIRVRFVGVEAGVSPIGCRRGDIRNALNQSVPFDCVPGTIEYLAASRVEGASWGRVKNLYR